ncbi:MAG: CDP-alcohol phosphatidyltransferase family protein [Hyphomicrobiales bacterium]|nr:CDP-alcohol phosphatidyltransferase family protein [Hyphomicrobiales bacterium]
MYLPNILTILRLILTPVIVWLIVSGRLTEAFAGCLIAGVTDAADGFLARRFHWQSALGSYLDPIADKFLLVSLYVTLGVIGYLPAWLAIAVVSRDILIVGAVLLSWLMGMPMKMRPLPLSKINTGAQVAFALIVLAEAAFSPGLKPWLFYGAWIVGALTLVTATHYVILWLKHMASAPEQHG